MFDMFDRNVALNAVEEVVFPVQDPMPPAEERASPLRPDGFQLPFSIWLSMFACYGAFIAALALATGGSGPAKLVLAVSIGFMLAYFGAGSIIARQGPSDRQEASEAAPLQTIYGPMPMGAVRAQVLTVPIALVFFGVSILIISSVVMG